MGKFVRTIEGLGISFSDSDRDNSSLFCDLNYEKGEGLVSRSSSEFKSAKRLVLLNPERDFDWNKMIQESNKTGINTGLVIKTVFEKEKRGKNNPHLKVKA